MDIVSMRELSEIQIAQAAHILSDELPNGWPSFEDAVYEIKERWKETEALFFAALEGEELIGWGGILEPTYDGNVFELHPLVVRKDMQRKGVGSALVKALENAAREKGGLTLWVGADDEVDGMETSMRNLCLYDDLPRYIRDFNPGNHQAAFYLKMGFKIIGVMPDSGGIGKPDIILGKRLVPSENK